MTAAPPDRRVRCRQRGERMGAGGSYRSKGKRTLVERWDRTSFADTGISSRASPLKNSLGFRVLTECREPFDLRPTSPTLPGRGAGS